MKQSAFIDFLKSPELVREMSGYTDANNEIEVHFRLGDKSITVRGHCEISYWIGDNDEGMPEMEKYHDGGPEISFHEILDYEGDPIEFWEYPAWVEMIRELIVTLILTNEIKEYEYART